MATPELVEKVRTVFPEDFTDKLDSIMQPHEGFLVFMGPSTSLIFVKSPNFMLSLGDSPSITKATGYLFTNITGYPDNDEYEKLAELDRVLGFSLTNSLAQRGYEVHADEIRRRAIRT